MPNRCVEEAFRVYLTYYHVLRAGGDARARAMLHTVTIPEPEAQRHFWEAMPGHNEV